MAAYIGKVVVLNAAVELPDGEMGIKAFPAIVTCVGSEYATLAVFRDGGWGECMAAEAAGPGEIGWSDVVTEVPAPPAPSVTAAATGSATGQTT